jgi:hypothetical protein
MKESLQASTSDRLNRAFTNAIISFGDKIDRAEWLDHLSKESPQIARLHTEPIGPNNEPLFSEFPDIYYGNIDGQDYLLCQTGEINLSAPIGEYGAQWATSLITAAITLRTAALDGSSNVNVIEETLELEKQRTNILEDAKKSKKLSVTIGKLNPFDEGLQSVLFAAGFFTAHKVSGFDDPEELLQYLSEQRIFSKFALFIPSTVTARMGYNGWVFTPPAIEGSSIAHHIVEHFTGETAKEYSNFSTGASKLLDRRGCPVARRLPENIFSGIDTLAQLLTAVVMKQNN